MGIWSGIKHALNSTLGTPYFETLDDIVRGQKFLDASDDVYVELLSANENNWEFVVAGNSTNKKEFEKKIRFKNSGSLKFQFIYGFEYNDLSLRTAYIIKKNGITISTLEGRETSGTDKNVVSPVFRFEKGDVFSFEFIGINETSIARSVLVKQLSILGTIKDNVFSTLTVV